MPDPGVEHAYLRLRSYTTGDLRFDEHVEPIRYVVDPASGRLVAPVMVAMILAVETVLFAPEWTEDGTLELMVTLEQFDEDGKHGGLADRWRIYHGDPRDVRWAFLDVDAARDGENVIDGEALMRPNPLADVESALCKKMNQEHKDDLRELCRVYGKADVETPVMVGMDTLGLDVRRKFDVVRVHAPEPMPTADDAERVLAIMREKAAHA
jgi:hypothetical protein